VLVFMGVDLEAPDHTTLSRCSQHLDVALNLAPVNERIHLIVDSPGLSIVGHVLAIGSRVPIHAPTPRLPVGAQ
jgi:hypothetical protein